MNTLSGSSARMLAFAAALTLAHTGWAKDAFDAVECDGDVANALVGGKIGSGPVASIEKRHAAISLRDEGGDEISDSVSYQSWTICGGSYHLLERGGVVRDVVRAEHSKSTPEFVGTCEAGGKPAGGTVLAILDASGGGATLPAKSAWRIDEAKTKFVAIDAAGLTCPRSGIATADGGA
ncbi:MAG: hypothetical protein ABW186_11260 [Rhodanobacteraceae bacterium]